MRLPFGTNHLSTGWLVGGALVALASIFAYWSLTTRGYAKMQLDSAQMTHFRVYWKLHGGEYSDANSTRIKVFNKKHFYTIPLTDLRNVESLRIDPAPGAELFRIKEISLYQDGLQPIRIRGKELLKLEPNDQISIPSLDRKGLVFYVGPGDPWLEYKLSVVQQPVSLWVHLLRLGLILASLFGLVKLYPKLTKGYRYVPYLMSVVLILVVIMATISRPNVHPDEHAHRQAALYFETRSALPEVCATDTLETYTNYGTSRLNTNEITYYLTGKFLHLIGSLPLDSYLKARAFNLLLFTLLLLLAATRPQSRLLLIPLLISPQIWYLFSYYNSDAFAIFAAILIGYQIVDPSSILRRLLSSTPVRFKFVSIAALCVLTSLLFLTKKNFYFFSLFLLFLLALKTWNYRHQLKDLSSALRLSGLLLLGGGALFAGWIGVQESINDFSRSEQIMECRELTALHQYKPSTPPDDKNWSLGLKDRGVTVKEMLNRGWPSQMFASVFGNYGYVAHPGSKYYYRAMGLLLLFLLIYLGFALFRRGDGAQRALYGVFLSVFGLMLAITVYKSWTVDYQPQGRYLFPMIPIAGLLLASLRPALNRLVLSAPVLLMALLGLFSFLSIGLLEITKYTF